VPENAGRSSESALLEFRKDRSPSVITKVVAEQALELRLLKKPNEREGLLRTSDFGLIRESVGFPVRVPLESGPCRPTLHGTRSSFSSTAGKASNKSSIGTPTSRPPGRSTKGVSNGILAGLSCFATALGCSPAATGRARCGDSDKTRLPKCAWERSYSMTSSASCVYGCRDIARWVTWPPIQGAIRSA
jgi:hypothetical protein